MQFPEDQSPRDRESISTHAGLIRQWLDANILELGRQVRFSYLPPLMVYLAAGISGLTGIVGTFFVKEYLGLSAEFLAALGFWAMLPWAMKMPMGHLGVCRTMDLLGSGFLESRIFRGHWRGSHQRFASITRPRCAPPPPWRRYWCVTLGFYVKPVTLPPTRASASD
ncbi:hypothetical protein ABZN20_02530 [Methylococcus sp. ANG]|uniref:hypothetical protein n=1 Tax=Methylococcus sp. ANG TaxID=3231903 RepID=UPI00345860E4